MQLVDDEVRALISGQYERVKALLTEKEKVIIDAVVNACLHSCGVDLLGVCFHVSCIIWLTDTHCSLWLVRTLSWYI